MKIKFGKSGLGESYWYIENNQGSVLVTPEEVKDLLKQIKKAGF